MSDAAVEIRTSKLYDLGKNHCPVCDTAFWPEGFWPTYDQYEKMREWTVAQMVAIRGLAERAKIPLGEFIDKHVAMQPRPGIGAIANPTVLGVDLHGIFIGVETDGYTHS